MTGTIYFEPYGGGNQLTTRQFSPGQGVRVVYHNEGGPLAAFINVSFDIEATNPNNAFSPIYAATVTNIWGDAWEDITLPNVNAQALVTVTGYAAATDTVTVPIGIGTPPTPLPSPTPTFFDEISKYIKYGAIAAIVIGVIYVAGKLHVTSSVRQAVKR